MLSKRILAVLILALLLFAFVLGFWINQHFAKAAETITFTQNEATSRIVTATTFFTIYLNANSSSESNSSTVSSSSANLASTASTISTSSSFNSPADIYLIPLSVLLNDLNLSKGIELTKSTGGIPYYIAHNGNSTSTVGFVYLTTDIAPSSCWGFNAQIETLAFVNATGFIKSLYVYAIFDSAEDATITQDWLNTYINRSVFERMQIGTDALPVTGATFSSLGVVDGVRDAGRIVVNDYKKGHSAQENGAYAFVIFSVLAILLPISQQPYLGVFRIIVREKKLESKKWVRRFLISYFFSNG